LGDIIVAVIAQNRELQFGIIEKWSKVFLGSSARLPLPLSSSSMASALVGSSILAILRCLVSMSRMNEAYCGGVMERESIRGEAIPPKESSDYIDSTLS